MGEYALSSNLIGLADGQELASEVFEVDATIPVLIVPIKQVFYVSVQGEDAMGPQYVLKLIDSQHLTRSLLVRAINSIEGGGEVEVGTTMYLHPQ